MTDLTKYVREKDVYNNNGLHFGNKGAFPNNPIYHKYSTFFRNNDDGQEATLPDAKINGKMSFVRIIISNLAIFVNR